MLSVAEMSHLIGGCGRDCVLRNGTNACGASTQCVQEGQTCLFCDGSAIFEKECRESGSGCSETTEDCPAGWFGNCSALLVCNYDISSVTDRCGDYTTCTD